jgi:hypothetical protein
MLVMSKLSGVFASMFCFSVFFFGIAPVRVGTSPAGAMPVLVGLALPTVRFMGLKGTKTTRGIRWTVISAASLPVP